MCYLMARTSVREIELDTPNIFSIGILNIGISLTSSFLSAGTILTSSSTPSSVRVPPCIKSSFELDVAFHSGPQQCLGRHMAHIEAKILTAMILQKFRFELVPNQNIVGFLGVVMPAENGINVTVSKV